jgi:outer membrane receptor protein involved in Fe transport
MRDLKFNIKVGLSLILIRKGGVVMRKVLLFLLFVCLPLAMYGQTTGKVAGMIYDKRTGEPLAGANIMLQETYLGATSMPDGSFYILNIPPGDYNLEVQMIGFKTVVIEGVTISVNRTRQVEVELEEMIIESDEVIVVQADKFTVKKDQTSSIRNVSSKEIEMLPVQSVGQVVSMQPGVVGSHFRGGRSGEVTYLVDGIPVDNALYRSQAVNVDVSTVQDLEVITGVFNAEYGNAMSGVVNMVTKDGGDEFHGSLRGYLGNYYSPHDDIFIGLDARDIDRITDLQFTLNGPIIKRNLNFFVSYRNEQGNGPHAGYRYFMPSDLNYDPGIGPVFYYHTGDNEKVLMEWNQNTKLWGKLTYRLADIKFSAQANWDIGNSRGYGHGQKYKPDGRGTNYYDNRYYLLQINSPIGPSAFVEASASFTDNFGTNYLYEDPGDPRYLGPEYNYYGDTGFQTGGNDLGYGKTYLQNFTFKIDLNWQISKIHSVKTGYLYKRHMFDRMSSTLRNQWEGTIYEDVFPWQAHIPSDTTIYTEKYLKRPEEWAAYIQDKMEFDDMTLNVGLRFDAFHPKTIYPSDWRNPSNEISSVNQSSYPWTPIKSQLSPRLGLGYKLGDRAVLHFSYGHFFQTPSFSVMYQRSNFLITPTNYSTTLGNPLVEAERTVQYEIGLWQELIDDMGLDVALFYRDIYDLSTVVVMTTYNQVRYGLYSNKDYGNARGLEVKYDFLYHGFMVGASFTLQYTRGVADNPTTTFNRAGDNIDPIAILIPMNWDQRMTFNMSVGYNKPKYGVTLTAWYNTNNMYTYSPIGTSPLALVNLYPNNSNKPNRFSADLTGFYTLYEKRRFNVRAQLLVYNLFDILNENGVYGATGRAYTNRITEVQVLSHRSDFTDIYDSIENPSMYSSPRQVRFGLAVGF